MGEPIVGYITRGKGVSVHSNNCPNVLPQVYDPERRIAVEWERGGEAAYEVRVAVQVQDRPGLLAALTAAVAGTQTDIRTAEARTFDDKTAAIDLTLRIQDLKHLERVVKAIRGVAGVIDIERQTVPRDRRARLPDCAPRHQRIVSSLPRGGQRATKNVTTSTAPAPIGPYSQGVIAGGLMFVSGQVPIDPQTGELVRGDEAARPNGRSRT